jgi:hypothetical protein
MVYCVRQCSPASDLPPDTPLSRRKQGFDSPWERQPEQALSSIQPAQHDSRCQIRYCGYSTISTPAQITAKWPDGTPVVAGDDARDFVFTEALRVGQDPQAVLRLALRDNLAGRTILALLGLTHEALKRPAHRPEDQQRQSLILGLVDEVSREEGRNGDELFAEVA